MSHSSCWKLGLAAATVLLMTVLPAPPAKADPPPALTATIRCKVQGKAIVCHVDAIPSLLSHISYSRADVLQAPDFLKVLVGGVQYRSTHDRQQRLNLAFTAKTPGEGDISVKVQAMVCADDGTSCPALARTISAHVKVGP